MSDSGLITNRTQLQTGHGFASESWRDKEAKAEFRVLVSLLCPTINNKLSM